ncbi:MAG TPA: type VI secretion system baseplate subunit TssF, partial [Pirellulaceae bacterium]|nr:type VI secretion system baseplate subunit TssF [Pirellulaceae bacterium]
MDPRFLRVYNSELQYLRERGAEFAKEFPKIAGRLGLDEFECSDPYVERLLEGVAFLSARVHHRLDAEFPRFTQHLLELVYPHYLAPLPSMTIVEFQADLTEGSLSEGYRIPRGTVLRGQLPRGEQTACDYRTAHDVTLWPLRIAAADYFGRNVAAISLPGQLQKLKAGLRLRLQATAGLNFSDLPLDRLQIHLRGDEVRAHRLYEQLFANARAILIRPVGDRSWHEVLPADSISRVGFDEDQALLPYGPQSFSGYRLINEYFAFSQRYLFFELTDLANAVKRCAGNELEIIILFDRVDSQLENLVDA